MKQDRVIRSREVSHDEAMRIARRLSAIEAEDGKRLMKYVRAQIAAERSKLDPTKWYVTRR